MGEVKFIRKNGRVIPIKGKGSAPKGSGISKRYGPDPKKDNHSDSDFKGYTKKKATTGMRVGFGATMGVLGAGLGAVIAGKKGAAVGGLVGAAYGGSRSHYYKARKGTGVK